MFHLTWATVRRARFTPTEDQTRKAVRTIARVGAGRVALFCVVDDHLHVVVDVGVAAAPAFASGLARALATVGSARLQPVHREPVDGRSHLQRLVPYLASQPHKHGIGAHPADWEGGCVADLLGARRLEGFDQACLLRHLPRWPSTELLAEIGLGATALGDESLDAVSVRRLRLAAARALCVDPALRGRTAVVTRARRALVKVAAERLPTGLSGLADELGLSRDAVARMAAHAVPADVRAVHLRACLDVRIRERR